MPGGLASWSWRRKGRALSVFTLPPTDTASCFDHGRSDGCNRRTSLSPAARLWISRRPGHSACTRQRVWQPNIGSASPGSGGGTGPVAGRANLRGPRTTSPESRVSALSTGHPPPSERSKAWMLRHGQSRSAGSPRSAFSAKADIPIAPRPSQDTSSPPSDTCFIGHILRRWPLQPG
jgi:hypothetical protein